MIYKLMIIKNNFIYFLEILVKLPVYCYRDRIFRGSSVVEQLTVNQLVVSSNLTRGAIYIYVPCKDKREKFLKLFGSKNFKKVKSFLLFSKV